MDSYTIELAPPDIEPYRAGNTGIPYYTTFDSGRPGPHVMINALTHGNELCGAIAVDRLLREGVRPLRGRLTLGFANVEAYHRFDAANPTESRYLDEDLNRVWSAEVLDGRRRSAELNRARQIRPLIETVDILLDIHSMQHKNPPLMLAGPWSKGRNLARALAHPEYVVCDAGHAAGRRLRDYGRFDVPKAPQNALLVECGQHWERRSADVALESALRVLIHAGMVDQAAATPHLTDRLPPQKVIEVTQAVTIESDEFVFADDFTGMEILPKAGTPIGRDGRREVVAPYDGCVLIMPSRRLNRGQTAVRLGRLVDGLGAGEFGERP
ncbi:MAG TPA: M14 family metallopeptidase [Alphaproteobacteria bacterium]|nr:M14 family metallopeptidase [Alphaproteobacteria bacterium]